MRKWLFIFLTALSLGVAQRAEAAGGNYVISGGTPLQQKQVRLALDASSFNWSLVKQQVTIAIARGVSSNATPGRIALDSELLDAGMFSWGVVQHEYAHQVDFFLLDPAKRSQFGVALGASTWCYGAIDLEHSQYGCERFASTLAWAYWPVAQNAMKPVSSSDESAAMKPAAFRALLTSLIGATTQPSSASIAYAPPVKKLKKTAKP